MFLTSAFPFCSHSQFVLHCVFERIGFRFIRETQSSHTSLQSIEVLVRGSQASGKQIGTHISLKRMEIRTRGFVLKRRVQFLLPNTVSGLHRESVC